jgi:hypothetical protein
MQASPHQENYPNNTYSNQVFLRDENTGQHDMSYTENAPASDIVADIADQMRKRERKVVVGCEYWFDCDWAVPIFDLREMPTYSGEFRRLGDGLVVPDREVGIGNLPYPAMVVVRRLFQMAVFQKPKTNEVEVVWSHSTKHLRDSQLSSPINVQHYRRLDDEHVAASSWFLNNSGGKNIWISTYQLVFSDRSFVYQASSAADNPLDKQNQEFAAFRSAMNIELINNPPARVYEEPEPLGEYAAQINAGREKGKRAPIQRARIFRFDRAIKVTDDVEPVGVASTKSPHDRRGHWRILKSGRMVWVSESKIHGGSATPPEYIGKL